jgi:hypothetical protein
MPLPNLYLSAFVCVSSRHAWVPQSLEVLKNFLHFHTVIEATPGRETTPGDRFPFGTFLFGSLVATGHSSYQLNE